MPRSAPTSLPVITLFSLLAAGCGGDDAGVADRDDAAVREEGGAVREAGADGASSAVTTAAVECGYAYSAFNDSPSVEATSTSRWTCSATSRSIVADGIPDHATGTFPNANNPTAIAAQSVAASMTLTPVSTGTAAAIRVVGYAMNGVKFDPSTAGTCGVSDGTTTCTLLGTDGTWTIEALGQSSFDFGLDANNAHVQPDGAYHYHGVPEGELARFAKGEAPTLVGFALDGFPVYARYGYTSAMDATSAVKVMKGSYALKSTPDAGRPPVDTYPMGAFTQDYEYVAGSGDLDECNGRTDVTPEFPRGIYHYYVTDSYPFIQRCVKGTAMAVDGGEPLGPPGEGGMPPPGEGGMPGPPAGDR